MATKDVKKYKHNKPWYVVQHPGKPTAKQTKLVSLPVEWLLTLSGMRDEHEVLTFETPKIRRMVDIACNREWQRKNPVTLNVLHDGKVIVEDGNHRIRAAKLGGMKTFLCKVVYYGGGENNFSLSEILDKYANLDIATYLYVLADGQGISGDGEVDGESADGEYAAMHDTGVDYGGEHNPDKDDERTMIKGQNDAVLAAFYNLAMAVITTSQTPGIHSQATVMTPTMPGATSAKPSFWERLKPHHQKILHTLVNQLYTPGFDDVEPEDNNPLNLGPGERLANLFRAALASDEVLEALVQIASSNGRCTECGNQTDQCVCLDSTSISPGYTQDGKQRQNNPVKTKSSLPKELNPSKGLGKL